MRNSINASTINVTVDRNDLVDVAGILMLHGKLSLHHHASPSASYASATAASAPAATATGPGIKNPGRLCVPGGKRPHCQPALGQSAQGYAYAGRVHREMQVVMSERLPQSWRSSRRSTFTSWRFAAA